MDRDQRWDRIERGYDAIVHGVGQHAPSRRGGDRGRLRPGRDRRVRRPDGGRRRRRRVRDRDPIVHVNFRADRARQLTHALADADFAAFDRTGPGGEPPPRDLLVVTMTAYEAGLPVEVAFGPEEARSLAQAFSEAGWTQFHVAETEKYAHVTYFFNGGREAAWPGEERRLVPSPRVATYDLQPEMSAAGVTDELVGGDRVRPLRLHRRELREPGHGRPHGRLGRDGRGARGARRLPRPRRRRRRARRGGRSRRTRAPRCSITADHGNADELRDAAGKPVTAHSLNPVPLARGGPARWTAGRCATASSPTSRRRSSTSPGCRAGRG